ncbi:MAG: TonB C-terminal domain-containing protein [Candidatus Brocadiaceae bacterium]|nr:TonB C-terminal domain-containing protein [Candidatus Brocadiaceae bacterium]
MFIKSQKSFFRKNLFVSLIAISSIIHGILIFLSPQAGQIFGLRSLRDSFIRESGEYEVLLEFEDAQDQKEKRSDTDTIQPERDKEKQKLIEKKRKTFADTSGNLEDEEPTGETDKIGEKGSLAKDSFFDEKQPVNDEPRAEGSSNAPLLGKGETGFFSEEKQQPQQAQESTALASKVVESFQEKNNAQRHVTVAKDRAKRAVQDVPFKTSPEDRVETFDETELFEQEKPIVTEKSIQKQKKERLTVGKGVIQDNTVEPLPNQEGVLFPEKQDDLIEGGEEETEKEKEPPLASLEEKKSEKEGKEHTKRVNEETSRPLDAPEIPLFSSELPDIESQPEIEDAFQEQDSREELQQPKVSLRLNAKSEGSNKDPVLFEDTISNAAIPGASSFNVKKHDYAAYFKHIRDRISLFWFLGYGTRAEIKLETKDDKPVVVEFKVLPDGSLAEVKIIDDAGNFQLASRLISSIKKAAPLNPFPPEIKESSVDVRFNFYFF